jgi:exodeoxyribonuclease-3
MIKSIARKKMLTIATWNINSLNVRLNHVLSWLAYCPVDVLALQELKMDQDKFPEATFLTAGYYATWSGQKSYNGVALLSRAPHQLDNVTLGIKDFGDIQRRVIAATIDGIRYISVYCVNGESLESEKFQYKLVWFDALLRYIENELTVYPSLVILGDFNIAPAAIDTYDANLWKNRVICSDKERALFKHLLDLGFYDSLRTLYPELPLYTWWDYRLGMFSRNCGLRIDHILVSKKLWPHVAKGQVDKAPRSWERPSDHTPVLLTLT